MKLTYHPQQGFTLLEGIVALSILTSLLVLGNHYTRQRLEASLQQQAAAHLRRVTAAAVRYAQDHTDYLGTTIKQKKEHENSEEADWKKSQKKHQDKKDDPISLEVWRYKKLLKQNYLPEISPRSERNLYGQGYALYILKAGEPTPRTQLLVITTGGKQLSERELRQIARQTGGQGGYISQQDKTQITGSQQGWQLELPAETIYLPSPDKEKKHYERPGHLACLHTLHPDDELYTQFLHRTPQPDRPQLNQMETNLRMQTNQIVFGNEKTPDLTMDANGLQFKSHKKTEHTITFGYDEKRQKTALEIKEFQKGSVLIEANRVTTTGKPLMSNATGFIDESKYSAPELHPYWNKVPYYEASKPEQLADVLCSKNQEDNDSGKKGLEVLGRFFMIGHTNTPDTHIYVCAYGNNLKRWNNSPSNKMTQAQLLAKFPQEQNQTAQGSTQLSISPPHSSSPSSLSPNTRSP